MRAGWVNDYRISEFLKRKIFLPDEIDSSGKTGGGFWRCVAATRRRAATVTNARPGGTATTCRLTDFAQYT
jgi:hypothetical protein